MIAPTELVNRWRCAVFVRRSDVKGARPSAGLLIFERVENKRVKIFILPLARMQARIRLSSPHNGATLTHHHIMNITPYTKAARKRAKSLLLDHKNGQIQIWKTSKGFQVVTFERLGNTYTSDPFTSAVLAFRHILCRAANTGNDIMRFKAIAERYAARYGVVTR